MVVTFFSPTQYQSTSIKSKVTYENETVHPAIIRVGLKYANWKISGSNARCGYASCNQRGRETTHSPNQVLQRHLTSTLNQ